MKGLVVADKTNEVVVSASAPQVRAVDVLLLQEQLSGALVQGLANVIVPCPPGDDPMTTFPTTSLPTIEGAVPKSPAPELIVGTAPLINGCETLVFPS